jgi:CheY-like chemotaxis protein
VKVLLVEDDHHNVELMRVRLEQLGCEAVVAGTADEALMEAREERPALAIVDLKLWGDELGGFRVIERLREAPETAGMTLIVHSVYVTHLSDMPAALPEVDGILPKPFTMKQLALLIEGARVLQRNEASLA